MKNRPLYIALLATAFLMIAGCAGPTASDVQSLNQAVHDGRAQLAQVQAAVSELKETAATQPGGAPIAQAAAKVEKPLAQLAVNADKVASVTQAAATAATQPGADPITVGIAAAQSAAPLLPRNIGGPVYLGALAASLIYGIFKRMQASKATTALTQTKDGLAMAVNNGSITATPEAATTVNANLSVVHPASDAVVDILAGATSPAKK